MLTSTLLLALTQAFLGSSKLLTSRQSDSSQEVIAPATYDGKCFYPTPDAANFELESYLGRWYQVAGTAFGPTAGCKYVASKQRQLDKA